MFWKRSREHTKHFLFQHESGMSPAGPNFRIAEKKKKKPRQRETQSKILHTFKSAPKILGENFCSVLLSITFSAKQVQLKKSLAWCSNHCWWWPPTPRDSPALPWVKVGHQLSPHEVKRSKDTTLLELRKSFPPCTYSFPQTFLSLREIPIFPSPPAANTSPTMARVTSSWTGTSHSERPRGLTAEHCPPKHQAPLSAALPCLTSWDFLHFSTSCPEITARLCCLSRCFHPKPKVEPKVPPLVLGRR